MNYVHVDPDLTEATVKIYNSLREHILLVNEAPSKMRLAHSCKLSTVTVYKAEKILLAKNYITAEKGGVKTMRPTDLDRVLSVTEPDPWAELDDGPTYWRME